MQIALVAAACGIIGCLPVGTPPAEDGSVDLRAIWAVVDQIGPHLLPDAIVICKSTVPVGTGRRVAGWMAEELASRSSPLEFDVVSNPEFLREGSAVQDFTHPDRVVIGSDSERARATMKDVYRALYLGETPYIETGLETAEMIKYASNAFLAVKITFINEVANLCEAVGADVQDVAKAMGRDGRIGAKFLHAGPGYGGSCFPKDTQAMARIGRDHGESLSIVEATILANERQKERMVRKIEKGMGGPGSLKGKTIAVPGTRTSAFLALHLFAGGNAGPEFQTEVVPFDQLTVFADLNKADGHPRAGKVDRSVDYGLVLFLIWCWRTSKATAPPVDDGWPKSHPR